MVKKIALSIAGFDPTGGAGILADVKCFHAHQVYGMAVVTANSIQNSQKVTQIQPVEPQFLISQVRELNRDCEINAIKIGMLATESLVLAVVKLLAEIPIAKIVLDPVLRSSSGLTLLNPSGVEVMISALLPKVDLITPNLPETEILSGIIIREKKDYFQAVDQLKKLGAKGGIIKAGHAKNQADDLLFWDDKTQWLKSERITNRNTHGTGCAFSSAITANLALGMDILTAVKKAKLYIIQCIKTELNITQGNGLIQHFQNNDH